MGPKRLSLVAMGLAAVAGGTAMVVLPGRGRPPPAPASRARPARPSSAPALPDGAPDFVFEVVLDLGEDRGQNLGTLFETRDGSGRLVCGAGFPAAYQTRRIVNNRALEFYARLPDAAAVVRDLGRTSPQSVRTELVTCGDRLIDVSVGTALPRAGAWRPYEGTGLSGRTQSIQIVAGRPMHFVHRSGDQPVSVVYGGQVLASFAGDMLAGLYYGGAMYVATNVDGAARLYRIRWSPAGGRRGGVRTFDLGERVDIYAMIGVGDAVFLGGAPGALFRIRGEEVRRFREAPPPNEFYAFLVCDDQLLAGHFPTGCLFRVDTEALRATCLDAPPLRPGQFGAGGGQRYREAQCLVLHRGDLVVGTYPWGHVWRRDHDTKRWSFRRMYETPAFSSERAPYSDAFDERIEALRDHPVARDHPAWLKPRTWGQRISSLIPFEDGLAVGLGNMSGWPYDPRRDTFFKDREWEQYGHVKHLALPYAVNAEIFWSKFPTRILLAALDDRLWIVQDGAVLASTPARFPAGFFDRIARIDVGRGVFGDAGVKMYGATTRRRSPVDFTDRPDASAGSRPTRPDR